MQTQTHRSHVPSVLRPAILASKDGTVRAWDIRMGARSLFLCDPYAHEGDPHLLQPASFLSYLKERQDTQHTIFYRSWDDFGANGHKTEQRPWNTLQSNLLGAWPLKRKMPEKPQRVQEARELKIVFCQHIWNSAAPRILNLFKSLNHQSNSNIVTFFVFRYCK